MAHEVERMAFTGRTPWHGLGSTLTDPTDVDRCFEEAGLNYEAMLGPCLDQNGNTVPFARSIVRSTDGVCVGVVGTSFQPLQCSEMAKFLRPWVESGRATIETAGSLREGRTVWALAKVGKPAEVGSGDMVDRYMLCAQAHDGTMAIRAGITPVRVVCANTLGAALSGGKGLVKIPHLGRASESLDTLSAAMEETDLHWSKLVDTYRRMTQVKIQDEDTVRKFVAAVFGEKTKLDKAGAPKKSRRGDAIVDMFLKSETIKGTPAEGNAWGLYNALTEYVTHSASTKAQTENVAGRADSLGFGRGNAILNKGTSMLEQILGPIDGEEKPRTYTLDEVFGSERAVKVSVPESSASA